MFWQPIIWVFGSYVSQIQHKTTHGTPWNQGSTSWIWNSLRVTGLLHRCALPAYWRSKASPKGPRKAKHLPQDCGEVHVGDILISFSDLHKSFVHKMHWLTYILVSSLILIRSCHSMQQRKFADITQQNRQQICFISIFKTKWSSTMQFQLFDQIYKPVEDCCKLL